MRNTILLAATAAAALTLSACDGATDETATAEPEAAAVEAPAAPAQAQAMAADGMPTPGTYQVTLANGDVWTETVNADGTYTSAGPNGETETGTWTQESPARYCTTAEGETEPTCYTEEMSAEGVWTSTEDGSEDVSTIVRTS